MALKVQVRNNNNGTWTYCLIGGGIEGDVKPKDRANLKAAILEDIKKKSLDIALEEIAQYAPWT